MTNLLSLNHIPVSFCRFCFYLLQDQTTETNKNKNHRLILGFHGGSTHLVGIFSRNNTPVTFSMWFVILFGKGKDKHVEPHSYPSLFMWLSLLFVAGSNHRYTCNSYYLLLYEITFGWHTSSFFAASPFYFHFIFICCRIKSQIQIQALI